MERSGADALGLIFSSRSSRTVSLERAALIVAPLSEHLEKVAVFTEPDWDRIEEVVERLGIDLIQWHGGPLSRDEDAKLGSFGVPWMHAIRWDGRSPLETPHTALRLLVEGRSAKGLGGTGEGWSYGALREVEWPLPVVLSGGLSPEGVAIALNSICSPGNPDGRRLFGVDVSSSVESRPGVKDEIRMNAFVKNVREWEALL
ncbi:MAG: phosphoribosylanthranilate isomerase [Nitrospirae bacterium]|nr:phosphoribosylanthranilate isomerase [Nitrospirota bacterium]